MYNHQTVEDDLLNFAGEQDQELALKAGQGGGNRRGRSCLISGQEVVASKWKID